MAAISANLLAAAAPSLTRLLNLAVQTATSTTQPTLVTGFANFLTQATATTTTTGTTTTETETDPTDTSAGSEAAAAVLAAIGLIPQQLPVQFPPVTADTTGTAPSQSLAASLPLDPAVLLTAPNDGTPSRSVELQLGTAPLTPGSPETTPILTLSEPTGTPVDLTDIPEPPAAPTPTFTSNTPVATTPGEVAVAAARPPAVAPQTPVVVDRSQQLPTQPAEVGYGLVGPAVNAPPAVNPVPAVGGTPSQAQVEQLASNMPAVEPTPRPTPTRTTAAPVQPFSEVLATESAAPTPDTTAPVQQVVTATPPTPSTFTPPTLANTLVEPPTTLPTSVPDAVTPPAFASPTFTPRVVTEPIEPVATTEPGQPQIAPLTANSAPVEPTPAAPPRVSPNAPPVAAQMCDAFVTHARVIVTGDTHEFQLRLDPPELGEVKVRVLATGDRIEARLVVSDDAVKRLIESQLPELRQRLEAAGVSVPTFDVSTDGGGKRADTGGDGWDHPEPGTRAGRQFRTAGGTPALSRPIRPNAPGGLLDVTA